MVRQSWRSRDSQPDVMFEQDKGKGVDDSQADEGYDESDSVESESDDSDFIVDEENMIGDVDLNMDDFMANIDFDEEWLRDTSQRVIREEPQCEEPAVEVMKNDELVSGSASDEGELTLERSRLENFKEHMKIRMPLSVTHFTFSKRLPQLKR
ncbi:hypothetical protein LXL04_033793 [Taraxacum kok-saghyz]